MDVLLLDNRDSFTMNIAHAFMELGATVDVVDAAQVDAATILAAPPRLVCIGPGPRGPADLPDLLRLMQSLFGRVPLFGVCLGLQAMVLASGGRVARALAPVHGMRRPIHHSGDVPFIGLPTPLWVMRYHSLVATEVPSDWHVTARDDDGQVMAIHHRHHNSHAVQFHPESIGTAGGMRIFAQALALAGVAAQVPPAREGSVPDVDDNGPDFAAAFRSPGADLQRPVSPLWTSAPTP